MAFEAAIPIGQSIVGASYFVSSSRPPEIFIGSGTIQTEIHIAALAVGLSEIPIWFAPAMGIFSPLSLASLYIVVQTAKPPPIFNPSVGMHLRTQPFRGGNSQFIDFIYADITFRFPGDMNQVEIKYPVIPINESNQVFVRMGNKGWRRENKTEVSTFRRTSVLRFRVGRSYLETFMNDLHSHAGQQIRVLTPGYTPFGINSSDNMCYVLDHTNPIPDRHALNFDVDITFLFVSVAL